MQSHRDSGSVTLLFQSVAGLEVLRHPPDGGEPHWIRAPCLPGHILVNLGDALSFWSGNQLKATEHRVTMETLPYNMERQSMAYFLTANEDAVLDPVVPVVDGVFKGQYGIVFERGMKAGEFNRKVMQAIYGGIKPSPTKVS